MTRPSPFSVRGRRALMVMRDEREVSIVRRQLSRLGMTISEHDPAEPPPPDQAADVILVDADSIPIKSDHATLWKGNVPIIALIGTETPSRLKWLLDLRPASFLIKPLRSAGLYTALVVAFDSAQRRVDEAAHIEKLEDRIRSRRVVFAAVLQIMRGHNMSETDAFTLIRQTAMRHRTTIEVLSAEIIATSGMPNRTPRSAYQLRTRDR
jgi:AmiR/NasT family two-component response regulator